MNADSNPSVPGGATSQHQQAEQSLRAAIAARPDSAEAHNNLGTLLAMQGQLAEAESCLRKAIAIRPDYLKAYLNLGAVLATGRRLDEAITCFGQARGIAPDRGEAHEALGIALLTAGRTEEAIGCYQQAIRFLETPHRAHSSLLLALHYLPQITPQQLLAEHRLWNERYAGGPYPPPPITNFESFRKLRVGYLSGDFREHPIAFFLEPVLSQYDRNAFEVFCYSASSQEDAYTQRLRGHAAGWRSLIGLNRPQAIEMVQRDRIDILVDLAGHTHEWLPLFAARAAPIQFTYMGYPGTTGLAAMDYRLTDAIADPPGEPETHSEKLARLEPCFSCFQPPASAPDCAALPALRTGVVTFGSMHKLAKLNNGMLDIWCALLRTLPSSRLLVVRDVLEGTIKNAILKRFTDRGIAPERVELRGGKFAATEHLKCYEDIDVSLDTLPWSGHTTACESLWMGVPVITMLGNRHAGRMVASVLASIGAWEWVARSPAEYVHKLVHLANDLNRLNAHRRTLRERLRRSPLCNAAEFTRNLEQIYRQVWQQRCVTLDHFRFARMTDLFS